MIGVKPLFSGRSLGEGETATFDVDRSRRPTARRWRARGLRYELLKIESRYQWYRRDGSWGYEPIKLTRRIADGQIDVAADKPGRIAVPVQWGRYRLEVSSRRCRTARSTSIAFDAGWYTEATADTPDMLEIALDKPEYKAGRDHDGRGHGAHRRPGHAQRDRRPADQLDDAGRAGRHRAHPRAGRPRLGQRRLCGRDLAPSARRQGAAHARPRHRRAMVLDRPPGAARSRST